MVRHPRGLNIDIFQMAEKIHRCLDDLCFKPVYSTLVFLLALHKLYMVRQKRQPGTAFSGKPHDSALLFQIFRFHDAPVQKNVEKCFCLGLQPYPCIRCDKQIVTTFVDLVAGTEIKNMKDEYVRKHLWSRGLVSFKADSYFTQPDEGIHMI